MSFNEKLQKLRKDKKLSQEDLAEMLDVSRQSVSKWESGVTYPEMDKLLSLCKIFDCTLEDLTNDNIKEINAEKKNPYQSVLDSILNFINKTYNYIVHNSFSDNLKCVIIMLIVAFIISIFKFPFNYLSDGIREVLTSLGNNNFIYFLINLFSLIINLIYSILSLTLFFYIFKIGFLDKYDDSVDKKIIVKEEKEKSNKNDEVKIINSNSKKSTSFISFIVNIVMFFIKIFLAFCTIPFIFGLIGLFSLLAFMIYLSINGLFYLGLFFCNIASIALCILVIEFLFNILFNKKHAYKRMLITLIISLGVLGFGAGLFGTELSEITYIDSLSEKFEVNENIQNIKMENGLYISAPTYINYEVDNSLNDIKIVTTYYPEFTSVKTSYNAPCLEIYNINDRAVNFKNMLKKVIEDLNDKKLYNYYNLTDIYVTVYTNQNNIELLKENQKNVFDSYEEERYSNEIEDLENEIDRLREKNSELEEQNDDLKNEITDYKTRIKEIIG